MLAEIPQILAERLLAWNALTPRKSATCWMFGEGCRTLADLVDVAAGLGLVLRRREAGIVATRLEVGREGTFDIWNEEEAGTWTRDDLIELYLDGYEHTVNVLWTPELGWTVEVAFLLPGELHAFLAMLIERTGRIRADATDTFFGLDLSGFSYFDSYALMRGGVVGPVEIDDPNFLLASTDVLRRVTFNTVSHAHIWVEGQIVLYSW